MTSDEAHGWRRVFEDHASEVHAYLCRRVGASDADDLLAETFHQAIRSSSTFDNERGTMRSWLYGIATNLLRAHWRSQRRHLETIAATQGERSTNIDPLLDVSGLVAEQVDNEAVARRLVAALDQLSHTDRDLLYLAGWERLTSREIGDALDVPPATVRSRLRRARTQLNTLVESPDPEGTTP